MALAKVKWFKDDKGYGFLEGEKEGEDIFVHYTQVEPSENGFRALEDWKGNWVEYEPVASEKGIAAHNVKRLMGAPQ